MSVSIWDKLFLPIAWEGDASGIAALAWRDDSLHAQIVLTENQYRLCFPQSTLSWPKLGELVLPEDMLADVQHCVSVTEKDNTLLLKTVLTNNSAHPVTLDFVRMALPMDQCFRNDDVFKYEQNVLRHTGLIGSCAYMYWQKPGGKAPIYLMVAQDDTCVNRFDVDVRYGQETISATYEGLYLLEMEDAPLTIPAHGKKCYAFRLAIITHVNQLNEALERLGGLGTDVLPGMAVPRGENLEVLLQTRRTVCDVRFEDDCMPVTKLADNRYQSVGAGAGEKVLNVRYNDGGISRLKFFVIDPVAQIIRDYAEHVATKQFETDSTDPCYHGLLAWNMIDQCRVNRKHNPFENWMAGGSDEIGLVSGLFLSEKNCYWPNKDEIRVLDLHYRDFIEARLTEQPGNRVHRMVPWFEMFEPWAGYGADDVWRAFNYVHVVNICLNLYRIARCTHYDFLLDAKHYLRRAYDYAIAMFSYWMFPEGKGATHYGNMGEMNYPMKLLPALREEGMSAEAERLNKLLEAKACYFSTRTYPFGSEMAFDTTAYEAVYGYGKAWNDAALCRRAVEASLSNRARTPIWHKYGVDVRGGGDSCWNVSYMTQLGIWPVVDMLLEGTLDDPDAAMIAHGAVLGGFTIYNSGGYWDEAPINRHATCWVLNERLMQDNCLKAKPMSMMSGEAGLGYFGALYSICAYVLEHPRMGEVALGCSVRNVGEQIVIRPEACFNLRLCDLKHHFAIVCEHAEIRCVSVVGSKVIIETVPLQGISGNITVRFRGRNRGEWICLKANGEKEKQFVFSIA